MAISSNRFFVTAIADGSTAEAVLYSSDTLSQNYNPSTMECTPNWNTDHPVIHLESSLGGGKKAPSTYKWYYNGEEILFSGNNSTGKWKDGDYPLFVKGTTTIDGVAGFPTLTIMRNLVSAGNTDQDVIRLDGSLEIDGNQLGFSVSIAVRLSQLTTSGWMGRLSGDHTLTEQRPTATIVAKLLNGTTEKDTFYTKWYKEGVAEPLPDNRVTYSQQDHTATVVIGLSDVDDYVIMRCEFYETNQSESPVATEYWEVDDETDPEKMFMANSSENNGVGNKNSASLRSGESVTFKVWMAKTGDSTAVDTRYTHFYAKVLDSTGTIVTTASGPSAGKTVIQSGTNKGMFDITATISIPDVTGTKTGGTFTVSYDYAVGKGRTISGFVYASTAAITS